MSTLKNTIKGNLPEIPIDYVTNDYEGFFNMMKEMIPTFTPEWTDLSDSDQGIVILQLLSYALHVLGYNQERVLQENILELARTQKGILTGCNYLGYYPSRQTASTVPLKIICDSDKLYEEKVIPKGSKFSTDPQKGDEIIFETMEELVIPAMSSEGTVNAIQGETIESEEIGMGNGKSNQQFTLLYPDVLEDSIEVMTEENTIIVKWEKVDNFLDSTPTDNHYYITLDEENRTVLHFGDGVLGRKIPEGLDVFATYRIGGGKSTNLSPNMITYVYEEVHDLNFIESVTNEVEAQGGSDYEDLEVAKIRAPKHYRSREQAVTKQDFEDIAELTEGIYKAKCVESFTSNVATLYVIGENYNVPNEALCQFVKDKIDSNRVGNVDLKVVPCELVPFSIKCKIFVHERFDEVAVRKSVEQNLRDTFSSKNFTFGDEFYAARVIDVCFNTAGVKNVILDNDVTKDTFSTDIQILKLNDVIVELGGI